jgi:preprotein translocase subunit Sss1
MKAGHRTVIAKVAICALLVTAASKPAKADFLSTGQVVGIGVAIGAIGAGIGIGIYYAVHHGHSLTGCAVSGASGLQLQNEGDQQSYALIGEVAGIKSGDRVRVSGKKGKSNAGAPRQFLVEKLGKDYGACKVP